MAGILQRLWTHLFTGDAQGRFPADAMERIASAIAMSESAHTGELCFAVEPALPWREVLRDTQARQRAVDAFGRLRVWDTAANNGVLIYLLLADHRIEIIADRGLHDRVSEAQWRGVCQLMEERLGAGEYVDGVVAGIEAAGDLLATHFPREHGSVDEDELPNRPVLL